MHCAILIKPMSVFKAGTVELKSHLSYIVSVCIFTVRIVKCMSYACTLPS